MRNCSPRRMTEYNSKNITRRLSRAHGDSTQGVARNGDEEGVATSKRGKRNSMLTAERLLGRVPFSPLFS